MSIRRVSVLALSAALLTVCAATSYANDITGATGTVTCSSYSLNFTGDNLNPTVTYSVQFSFTLTPTTGPSIPISGSVPIPAGTSFNVSVSSPLGPLTGTYTVASTS